MSPCFKIMLQEVLHKGSTNMIKNKFITYVFFRENINSCPIEILNCYILFFKFSKQILFHFFIFFVKLKIMLLNITNCNDSTMPLQI